MGNKTTALIYGIMRKINPIQHVKSPAITTMIKAIIAKTKVMIPYNRKYKGY